MGWAGDGFQIRRRHHVSVEPYHPSRRVKKVTLNSNPGHFVPEEMKNLIAHFRPGDAAKHMPVDRLAEFIDFKVQEKMFKEHGKYNDPQEIKNCKYSVEKFASSLAQLNDIRIFRQDKMRRSGFSRRVSASCMRTLARIVEKRNDVTNSKHIDEWAENILKFARTHWTGLSDDWFVKHEGDKVLPNYDTFCHGFELHLDEFLRKNHAW